MKFPEAVVNQVPLFSGILGPSLYTLKFNRVSYLHLCELLTEVNLAEYCGKRFNPIQ